MDLASFIALNTGIVLEILLLWDASERRKKARFHRGILLPRVSRLQEIIILIALVSWILIAVFDSEFFKPGISWRILEGIQLMTMLPLFLFLFAYGVGDTKLLPRVNEQTIVVVTAIASITLVRWAELVWYMWPALLFPLAGIILMALTHWVMPPTLKSLFYFWYLICLLLIAYQSNFELFFYGPINALTTPFDYFTAGAASIFLLLHSIFLVRFSLMLSANILPKNRYLIRLTMPQLFSDEQMPRYQFLVILLLVVVLLWTNYQFGFLPDLGLASLLILFTVYFMDRSFKIIEGYKK